ncbi:MAG: hypothetical protein ACOCUW_05540 [Gemmatimonadota bacterium]
MAEAGALVRRREPPLRLVMRVQSPSTLRRRTNPGRRIPRPDAAVPPPGGHPRALLKRHRHFCCPGMRRRHRAGPRLRLRRRPPRTVRRLT